MTTNKGETIETKKAGIGTWLNRNKGNKGNASK